MGRPRKLTVGGFGSRYRKISQAIQAADAGDIIQINPGTYEEALNINKPIMLMGASADEVIIQATGNHTVTIDNTFAHIHHVTIKQLGNSHNALYVNQSKLEVSSTTLMAEQGEAAIIVGSEQYKFKNSRFINWAKQAFYIKQSYGEFHNCLFDPKLPATLAIHGEGGQTIVQNCTIQNVKMGAYFNALANVQILESRFENLHAEDGSIAVRVDGGQEALLKNSKFNNGNGNAVHFLNGTKGIIENCEFTNFTYPSVAATQKAMFEIYSTTFNNSGGIILFDESKGNVVNSFIQYPTTSAIEANNSHIDTNNIEISYGKVIGLKFVNNATGTVEKAKIWGFDNDVAVVVDNSTPTIIDSEISKGKSNGMVFVNGAKGKVTNTVLHNFLNPAVATMSGAEPIFENVEISNVHSNALLMDNGGKGLFSNCSFHTSFGEKVPLVVVKNASQATISGTKFYDGRHSAVLIGNGGKLVLHACELYQFPVTFIEVEGGILELLYSNLHDGGNTAIALKNTNYSLLLKTKIHNFKELGVALFKSTNNSIKNVEVTNTKFGIGVGDNSSAELTDVTTTNQEFAGVLVQNNSRASLTNFVATDSPYGLYVEVGSQAEATNVDLKDFAEYAVVSNDHSNVTIRNGMLSRSQKAAFLLRNNSKAKVVNTLFDNDGRDFDRDMDSRYETENCTSVSPTSNDDANIQVQKKMDNHQDKVENDTQFVPKAEETKVIAEEDNTENNEILQELDQFVGLTNIKKSIKETMDLIKVYQWRKEMGLDLPFDIAANHMVFYGNPGTGKTTIARIFGKIYKSLGLLEKGHVVEVGREQLVGRYIGESEEKTTKVLEEARGGILFIDEAYTLVKDSKNKNDFGREVITTLLRDLENNRGKYVCIVAGYEKEMQEFLEANPGLTSRFKEFYHFQDYTPDELMEIANRTFAEYKFHLDEEAKALLYKEFVRIYRIRDEHFGNARTVRNLCNRIIRAQAKRIASLSDLTRDVLVTIVGQDVKEILPKEQEVQVDIPINEELLEKHLARLNSLVGLQRVKDEITQLINLVRYYKEEQKDLSTLTTHMLLIGNPGTGKTEVAKIIGGIYEALGILERGVLIEVDRDDLVDKYRGGTEEKTNKVIDEAMGGTLFIDEAYTLTNKSSEDPGHAAVEILLKRMEDERGKFVVLAAGYEDEMESFLDSNKGLRRRFDRKIIFEDYQPDEMIRIFEGIINGRGYRLDDDAKETLVEYFEHLYNHRDKTYGNAGLARKIALNTIKNLDYRLSQIPLEMRSEELKSLIQTEDLDIPAGFLSK